MSEPDRPDRLAGESMRHYTRRPVPDRTCATCQHWDPPGINATYVHTYGVCEGIHQDHHDGDGFPAILDTPPGPGRLHGLVATVAGFACNLHQPTTDETNP